MHQAEITTPARANGFTVLRAMRKTVCSLVSASIMVMPTWAFGTETNMSAIGHEAQDFANDIAGKFKENPNTFANGTVTMTMPDGTQQTIKQTDLQGSTGKEGSSISSSMTMEDIEALKGIYNSGEEMGNRGDAAKESLFKDAQSVESGNGGSLEGYVYSVLNETYLNRPDVDMSNDPMFDKTYEIIDDLENIVSGLADCSAETIIRDKTDVKHIPDYKECTQVLDHSGTCTLNHYYTAGIIQHHEGPYNLDSCGTGCALLWIGRVGDNYWSGHCSVYEQNTVYRMVNPSSVKQAILEYAKWDDYMQVWIGPPGKETKVWSGPNENFPPETGGACELSKSWSRNPNVDVTHWFKNVEHNSLVNFKIRASVTGGGEGFGRIRIFYEPSKTVYEESWAPQECFETLNAVNDGFAEGTVKCTDMPQLDANGCMTDNGIIVCPHDMSKPPHPSINPLCRKMTVTTNWDFYKGQMDCWIDANGNRQCPENVGGKLDTCKQYEENPECQFIRSQCTEGASGASGTCYVNDVVYDCGKDVPVTDKWADTQYKCPGDIACMGNDCIDTQTGVSTDFAKVTALLNAMQYMTQDMTCEGMTEDGDYTHEENVVCTVFGGEAGECKRAVGGVSDCCEPQPGIGIGTYISMIKGMADLDSSLVDLSKAEGAPGMMKDLAGQYVEFTQPVKDLITQPQWFKDTFGTFIDNISGAVKAVKETATKFVDDLVNKITEKCSEMLADIFRDAGMEGAAESVAGGAATEASKELMAGAAQVFTVVSAIYTAYVVATMIIQMVYACEPEEYEMISNRELGNCHFVGSYCKSKVLGACIEKRQVYCCYQSPLSRIMNEQIRLQGDILGIEFDGFGTAKEPKCNGIPLDKIDKVDWDRVDLSEWIATLDQTGNLPNNENISLEALTGKGSKLDLDGTRLNTIERTLERLGDAPVDEIRSEFGQAMEVERGNNPQ